jgi:hypothetical protein
LTFFTAILGIQIKSPIPHLRKKKQLEHHAEIYASFRPSNYADGCWHDFG